MTPSDNSNDPLTAPSWPTGAVDDSVLDPHTTEQLPDDDAMRTRRSVPKPPDVDQILRGEYTDAVGTGIACQQTQGGHIVHFGADAWFDTQFFAQQVEAHADFTFGTGHHQPLLPQD